MILGGEMPTFILSKGAISPLCAAFFHVLVLCNTSDLCWDEVNGPLLLNKALSPKVTSFNPQKHGYPPITLSIYLNHRKQ